MSSNISNIDFKTGKQLKVQLVSPIDIENKDLVANLAEYVLKFQPNSQISLIYNSKIDGKEDYIFNNVKLDRDNLFSPILDVAFLLDGNNICGHVVSVIEGSQGNDYQIHFKRKFKECYLDSDLDIDSLYNYYFNWRFGEDIEKICKGERIK